MSKKPDDNAFQQQRLKAWQPLLTPKWVIGTFTFVGLLFLPLGGGILAASNGVYEVSEEYHNIFPDGEDEDNMCHAIVNGSNCDTTTVRLSITEDVDPPIYFYYQLTSFYQNHRRYVKSRDDDQLAGTFSRDVSSCDPLGEWNDEILYPCGLIANSQFNDTFTATVIKPNGDRFNLTDSDWDESDIAWDSDSNKFDPITGHDDDFTRIGPGGFVLGPVDDPHFMVWMRTAGLPNFKKLYAVINDRSLKKNDEVEITFINTFPVHSFDGTKSVVLSTTSWLGGKNPFLGIAYIVVGVLCLLLAMAFAAKHHFAPRELGDMKYFNWPTQNSKTQF